MELFKKQIGSKLHGFATEQSDDDYVVVYTQPLRTVLSLSGNAPKGKQEHGENDTTRYELRHFCNLLIKGNPTVYEGLNSNMVIRSDVWGWELTANMRKFYDAKNIFGATRGYVMSTMKEADNPDFTWQRRGKKCLASIRILEQTDMIFTHGAFSSQSTFPRKMAVSLKMGDPNVVPHAIEATHQGLENFIKQYENNLPDWTPDIDWINDFLYRLYTQSERGNT